MLTRQFLTVKQVADLLKVGQVTVRHWIKGGELRAIDVGREWRIAPTDLEDFLQRHATTVQSDGKSPQVAGARLSADSQRANPGEVKKTRAGKGKAT